MTSSPTTTAGASTPAPTAQQSTFPDPPAPAAHPNHATPPPSTSIAATSAPGASESEQAIQKAFAIALDFASIDLVELNEAFAVQVLGVLAGWQWDEQDKLNVNGSGISLGHPIGATGARMLATGLRELRRRQGRYLLETMCVGGGQGVAAVFEAA